VADVGCQDLVDFDPSHCWRRFRDPSAPDMFMNVESVAGHITVSRLAQRGDRPWIF
jgi:hypothetical protein